MAKRQSAGAAAIGISFGIVRGKRSYSIIPEGQFPPMIPPFDESGCLPAGIHPATLEEIDARFGQNSELRRVQMESVRWMVELARQAGVERIVLNGSFVTDIMEPNDVDCVLLIGAGYPKDRQADMDLRAGLPFIDIAIVRHQDFQRLVNLFFATDRFERPKGVVEIIQWT
jgi:hypothetical protein